MNPVLIDSDLKSYLDRVSGLDPFPSALAIFNNDGDICYQNQAFDSFNKNLKDSNTNTRNTGQLIDCENIKNWLLSVTTSTQCEKYTSTFYYSKNITVDLTLLSVPIINKLNVIQGRAVTIAEESIEYDGRHLAKLQESKQILKKRIVTLSEEKDKHDRLIQILLKNSPFALIVFNENQQIVQTNTKAGKMFGLTVGQMIGRHWSQIIDCYQNENNDKELHENISTETEEINCILKSGKEITLLRSTERLVEKNETLIIEAFIDITLIKQTENEVKRLDEINTLLVNSTGEGILSIDNNLICTFINNAGADMLGYTPNDMLGNHIHDIFWHSDEDSLSIENHELVIKSVIEHNISKEIETTFQGKDGKLIPVHYLCSPIHQDNQVCGAVIVYRDVSESRAIVKKLDYLATHDALTGLLNRYAFEARLTHLIEENSNGTDLHMLCFIDLDRFKIINDTVGHPAGDELLRQISNLIQQHIRKSDILARLGGDEYGLLLCNCKLEKSTELLEGILHKINDYRFSWGNKVFTVGASIGLVEMNETINDVSTAMNAADSACYIAKKNGRHRIHIYQHDDHDIEQYKLEYNWVNRIKDSLTNDRLQLWHQPIIDIERKSTKRHFEILIRMQDENNNIISPSKFIPIAERYNLMTDIDKWVIRAVIKYMSSTDLKDIELIAVNISGQSISDDLFISFIYEEFSNHKNLTPYICFEVTETSAISNLSKASEFMLNIKKMGFSFALDDFGSGMSSFIYLKNLPIDYLKIDGNFIRNIHNDNIDQAMVDAIHTVGKAIGIKTIAEFVENDQIIDVLKTIGIDYIQGYAIDKPKPLI